VACSGSLSGDSAFDTPIGTGLGGDMIELDLFDKNPCGEEFLNEYKAEWYDEESSYIAAEQLKPTSKHHKWEGMAVKIDWKNLDQYKIYSMYDENSIYGTKSFIKIGDNEGTWAATTEVPAEYTDKVGKKFFDS
jgi:hypothetical protein